MMWQRKIYRASRLDEFRSYLSGEHWDESEYTPADFVRAMTEEIEPTAKIQVGTAVHKVMEHALFDEMPESVACDGWKIYFALDAEIALPARREVPLDRTHKGVTLYGRCDALDDWSVHDLKTTGSVDIDRYVESAQWKAYLWMSGRRNFVYHFLKVVIDEKAREVEVREYTPCAFHAYPAMDRDVERLLLEFDAAVKSLGIPEIMQGKAAA